MESGPAAPNGSVKLLLAENLCSWRRSPGLFLTLLRQAKEVPIIQNLSTKQTKEDAIPKDGRSLRWKALSQGKNPELKHALQ